MWMQHYLACDDVQIDGITVTNHVQKNNDGIDIDGCQNVTISNCIIDCIDDAICLKSTSDRITKNVTINNCVVRTHCGGIDFGTESNGGFQNILINNICIDKAAEGISLKLVDGGEFNRVSISNVTMDGVKSPIFLRLGNRARPYLSRFTSNSNDVSFEVDDVEIPGMGSMKNIIISNVFATNASNWGCYITGITGHYIENLTLKDINLQFAGGGKKEWAQRNIPENPTKYPGVNQFDGPSPAYAFFIRHVKNLRMENVKLTTTKPDARDAIVLEDVSDAIINGKVVEGDGEVVLK
jgi:polygalacturonase